MYACMHACIYVCVHAQMYVCNEKKTEIKPLGHPADVDRATYVVPREGHF